MTEYRDQVSRELTELRTVLSRAETALDCLRSSRESTHSIVERHDMRSDLEEVVSALARYRGKKVSRSASWRRTRDQRGRAVDDGVQAQGHTP